MDASQTYRELHDRELAFRLSEEGGWSIAFSPKDRIDPELRAAIKEHKMELILKTLTDQILGQASEELGLELDLEKMPPASPEIKAAYANLDPGALVEALGDYITVWQCWPELQEILANPNGGALVLDDWGMLLVAARGEAEDE